MKHLTKVQIKEIAEELDSSFKCYWNLKTNELFFVPDLMADVLVDEESWEEELDKINENAHDLVEIERPTSHDSFLMMAAFCEGLPDDLKLKAKLKQALNKRKPFREFKYEMDNDGDYRQAWFDFKAQKLEEWVTEKVEQIKDSNFV
jgi:hypothetical protein